MEASGPARVLLPGKPEQPALLREAAGGGAGPLCGLRVRAAPPSERRAGRHGDRGPEAGPARRGAGPAAAHA